MPLTPYTRPADGQVRLLTKVARMYHERGVRQADIAAALNISQAKVSRLLKRAESVGIVRTIVTVAPGVYAELEEQLEEKYGSRRRWWSTSTTTPTRASCSRRLGAGAAAYLEATLSGSDRIGVSSWSQTILAMVDRMRPFTVRGATEVVQLLGGVGAPEAQSHSNRILGELARTLGAEPVYVQAPGIVGGPGDPRQPAAGPRRCRRSRRHWRELTMAIMGIGSIEPSRRPRRRAATRSPPRSAATSSTQGAVGDICHRIFRADGSLVRGESTTASSPSRSRTCAASRAASASPAASASSRRSTARSPAAGSRRS